jgi:hypothetical protein
MVATHLNCFQEINKSCQILHVLQYGNLSLLFFFLFLLIMRQNTLCCLYFSLTAWREPPLLLRYKSCIIRTHSFKSAGL